MPTEACCMLIGLTPRLPLQPVLPLPLLPLTLVSRQADDAAMQQQTTTPLGERPSAAAVGAEWRWGGCGNGVRASVEHAAPNVILLQRCYLTGDLLRSHLPGPPVDNAILHTSPLTRQPCLTHVGDARSVARQTRVKV